MGVRCDGTAVNRFLVNVHLRPTIVIVVWDGRWRYRYPWSCEVQQLMPTKSALELAVRRRVGLPRHSTANDEAVVLLRLTLLAIMGAFTLVVLGGSRLVARGTVLSASAFAGLSLQQYCWYTGQIYQSPQLPCSQPSR